MKNIKNLNIKTLEGFEVKNLQRFPSMEWGDEGGCKADVWYMGAYVGTMYQEGNGGSANFDFDRSLCKSKITEINTSLLTFLKRKDPAYSKYDWLVKKTPSTMNDDDFEALVNVIEERYNDVKEAKKYFNKNYISVAFIKTDLETLYLSHQSALMSVKYVDGYMKAKQPKVKYNNIEVVSFKDDLSTL